MAKTTFNLTITINKPLQTVITFYNNMQNHLQIHPLIQNIELIEEKTNTNQQLVSQFKIKDKLFLFGFIPYQFYYQAIRTFLSPTIVQFEVASSFGIIIKNVIEFIEIRHTNHSDKRNSIYTSPFFVAKLYTKKQHKKHIKLASIN